VPLGTSARSPPPLSCIASPRAYARNGGILAGVRAQGIDAQIFVQCMRPQVLLALAALLL
jgi:hypothetical protein